MRDRNRTILTGLALAAAVVLGRGTAAQDAEGYGDGYQEGDYGRIRYADGGASILRADGQSEDSDRAGLNAPIFPGDTVRTGSEQRVEVQLASGTLVRLDRGSAVRFQAMPDPYAKFQDNAVLVLQGGAVRIQAHLSDKEEFRIDTDAGAVYLLGEGDFRIENDGRGRTTVASLRGVAEVVGSQGSVLVRGGSRTTVAAGDVPEEPRAYSAYASDGFDRWCEIRDAAYRDTREDGVAQNDVPYEVRPYYGELSSYGNWVVVPDYGSVWYPSGVAAGWRPYHDGYWGYGPSGYFWVSYEPWGWAPYRYGNWQWVGTYGWCWVPGNVFAGAWVSWSWGSAYFGWAPLNYYGYPCYRYGGYRYGYYDPDCWTFVNYNNAYATNVKRYAVPVGSIGSDLRTAQVVTRAPRISPSRIATSADGRARAIRQVSEDRAAAIRPGGNRRLADISQDVLKRTPRSAERSAARPSERFPRRALQDTRTSPRRETDAVLGSGQRTIDRNAQSARPPSRGNGQRTIDRSATSARPPSRGNEQRSIDRSATSALPPSRGNEQRSIDRSTTSARPPSGGNEQRSIDRSTTSAKPPTRGNERRETQAVQPARPQARANEPSARSNVRDLYERVSRPRETRPSQPSRPQAARPQTSSPRSQPQAQAPRPQGAAPRSQGQAPRSQGVQKSGGGQQAKPRGNSKH